MQWDLNHELLKIKEVETYAYGAGHVALEVYLNDLKKWIFIDSQWNIIPFLNHVPLNAVEFQQAIVDDYQNLDIKSKSESQKESMLIGLRLTYIILIQHLIIEK